MKPQPTTNSLLVHTSSMTHTNMQRRTRAPGKGGRRFMVSGQSGLQCIVCTQTDHMLRQHVYRCHIMPITCPGCSQMFDSSRMFAHHLHAKSQCDRSLSEVEEPIRGLETLIQKIRAPTGANSNSSDEHMWKVIYSTLFPKDARKHMPSPCECCPLSSGTPVSSYR